MSVLLFGSMHGLNKNIFAAVFKSHGMMVQPENKSVVVREQCAFVWSMKCVDGKFDPRSFGIECGVKGFTARDV